MELDLNSESGLTGLPPQWAAALAARLFLIFFVLLIRFSGLVKDDVINHKDEVLAVLAFNAAAKSSQWEELDIASIASPYSGMANYCDIRKIGEGASGQVFPATSTYSLNLSDFRCSS